SAKVAELPGPQGCAVAIVLADIGIAVSVDRLRVTGIADNIHSGTIRGDANGFMRRSAKSTNGVQRPDQVARGSVLAQEGSAADGLRGIGLCDGITRPASHKDVSGRVGGDCLGKIIERTSKFSDPPGY